ncbi:hypothetical protein ALC60_05721 [Trachymyrmex zeteki]|nr:hypothetical protein ALC60_05721 [Trachymyrmex zeteki]
MQIVNKHTDQLENHATRLQQFENRADRLQLLENKVDLLLQSPSKVRPDLQYITHKANLSPIAQRLYKTNIQLRHEKRRLKRLLHSRNRKIKEQTLKTQTLSLKRSSNKNLNNSIKVRERFINMIFRNNNVPPEVINLY